MTPVRPIIAVLLLCPACSFFETRGEMNTMESQQAYWLEMDATRRAAYVAPDQSGGNGLRVLAEPAPDAMVSRTVNLLVEAASDGSSASRNPRLDLVEKAAELTQQAETVKFLREALYRISELSFNGMLGSADVVKLYTEATKAAIALAQAKYARPLYELLKQKAKLLSERSALASGSKTAVGPEMTANDEQLRQIDQYIQKLIERIQTP